MALMNDENTGGTVLTQSRNRLGKKHVSLFLHLIMTGVVGAIGVLYYQTMAPSIAPIDSGELAAVQSTLGIAHPTGYPLFTLLGTLFLRLPLFSTKIEQANFLSLLWCTACLFIFMKTLVGTFLHFPIPRVHLRPMNPETFGGKTPPGLKKARRQTLREKEVKKRQPFLRDPASTIAAFQKRMDFHTQGIPLIPISAAILASLFLAFSRTFWLQSTAVEVYSLHLLLLSLALGFALRIGTNQNRTVKEWFCLSVVLALALSNHLTSFLIFPGLVTLYLMKEGLSLRSLRTGLISLIIFLVVWSSVLLYLPIRASQSPLFNWGNPSSWERLIRHISGAQYRVWFFSSPGIASRNLVRFLKLLPGEFSWFGLILGIAGIPVSMLRAPRLFPFLFMTFLVTVAYVINYDIHDLDAYFLPSFMIFAVWIAFALEWGMNRFRRWIPSVAMILSVAALLVFPAVRNYRANDRKALYLYSDYTRRVLDSMESGSTLFSYQWDYLISPSYYIQGVEGYRKDIAVIDKELLRRSWYFVQIKRHYPDFLQPVQPEVDRFVESVIPFERNKSFDAGTIELNYRTMIYRMIETSQKRGAVYIAPELVEKEFRLGELALPLGLRLVPDLFCFKVTENDGYSPLCSHDTAIRFPQNGDRYSEGVRQIVYRMWIRRALYELKFRKTREALLFRDMLLRYFPHSPLPDPLRSIENP